MHAPRLRILLGGKGSKQATSQWQSWLWWKKRLTHTCVNQDVYGLCHSLTAQRRSRSLLALTLVWKQENRGVGRWRSSTQGEEMGRMMQRALLSGGLQDRAATPWLWGRMGQRCRGDCQGGRGPGPRCPHPSCSPTQPRPPSDPHPPHAQPVPGSGSGRWRWSSCEGGRLTVRRETGEREFRGFTRGGLLSLDSILPTTLTEKTGI